MNRLKDLSKKFVVSSLVKVCVFASITVPGVYAQEKPQVEILAAKSAPDAQGQNSLATAVRHELIMLPYYGVFDWLEAEIESDGTVVLRGDVVRPTTKADAEYRVKRIESVKGVRNEIHVAPLFPSDNALRVALYRAIYNYNSPLFRYGIGVNPPIHIVVNNGRASLRGVVASKFDSQIAYTFAN